LLGVVIDPGDLESSGGEANSNPAIATSGIEDLRAGREIEQTEDLRCIVIGPLVTEEGVMEEMVVSGELRIVTGGIHTKASHTTEAPLFRGAPLSAAFLDSLLDPDLSRPP
jgi:hypothetical protein